MGTAPTAFAEIVKVRFGAPVLASDGSAGVVVHAIVDPATRSLSHVGIKLSRIASHAYSVPVALLTDARSDAVELSITRAEIPEQAQEPSPTGVRLTNSTAVEANSKHLGRLVQLSAHQQTQALYRLVVDRGLGRGEVLVPVDATTALDARHIGVYLDDTQLQQLTAYRPDAELLQEVNEALFNYPRLRIDLRGMQVRAVDGEVWLRGHVSSDLNCRIVEDQLQGIPGLAAIHNELMADTDLAAAIAAALARDPRTQDQHIGVYPTLGEVHLRGVVGVPEAREAASQIAEAVPGVERVVNELTVRPGADVVPTFASITGKEDEVPGGS